jgi:HK97 family phage major capsid protein
MNKLELQEKRGLLQAELNGIIAKGEAAKRKLEESEEARIAEIKAEMDSIDEEIRKETKKEEEAAKCGSNKKKKVKRMKLVELINKVVENRAFSDEEQAMLAEARSQMAKSGINCSGQIAVRTLNASTATEGKEAIATDKMPLEISARNARVASEIGATYLDGLVGNVSFPAYGSTKVGWKGENVLADNGEGAFKEITLSPKRLTAVVEISKQLIAQTSDDVEAMIIRDLNDALGEKLDETIFAGVASVADAPKPISNVEGIVSKESAEAAKYADILGMEQAIEEANGNMADAVFVVAPNVKYAFKAVQTGNGLPLVLDNESLDGYPYVSSNSVPKGAAYLLCPRDLVIGSFGSAVDITVDAVTKADQGMVRLIVNGYYDFAYKSKKIALTKYTA